MSFVCNLGISTYLSECSCEDFHKIFRLSAATSRNGLTETYTCRCRHEDPPPFRPIGSTRPDYVLRVREPFAQSQRLHFVEALNFNSSLIAFQVQEDSWSLLRRGKSFLVSCCGAWHLSANLCLVGGHLFSGEHTT